MLQKFFNKTSKLIPLLSKKTLGLNHKIPFKLMISNYSLFKNSNFNFSDKNEKGKKDKENKQQPEKAKNTNKDKDESSKKNTKQAKSEEAKDSKSVTNKASKPADKKAQNNLLSDSDIDKLPNLSPDEKENYKKLNKILSEKDPKVIFEKYTNFAFEKASKDLGIYTEIMDETDKVKDYKSTDIVHNYEKEFGVVNPVEKAYIENVTKNLLKDHKVDAKEAQFLRERRRDIISYSHFDRLRDLKTPEDIEEYLSTFTDYKNFEHTNNRFNNLVQLAREIRDMENPAFIELRSIDRLLKNEEKVFPKPRNVDTRQNANSQDYLKIQPRMKIDYAYNYEKHREFFYNFDKIFAEDQKKLIEKMKLIKYIKSNPNDFAVQNRWIPKNYNVPIEVLPDYDVDITGYKPESTKKSKRKYAKRSANDIRNYEAWRAFDRTPGLFCAEEVNIHLELSPKNLIHKFGEPSAPVYEESTGLYIFEDENLDIFILTDFAQTTQHHGPNYSDEFYEVQKEKVQPKLNKKKYPSPDEFWNSEELMTFKLYYPMKSDVKRFKKWLRTQVNNFDITKEKTIEQIIEEKFGKLDDYSDYKKDRKTRLVNAIYNYSPSFFMEKDEKVYFKPEPLVPPKYISAEEGEFFDYDEYMKIEASKSKEMRR